jgi:hypothetical protein
MLDSKLATQSELLGFVAEVRRGVDGPSTATTVGRPEEIELSAVGS